MKKQRPRPEQPVKAKVRAIERVGVELRPVGVGGRAGPEDEGVRDSEGVVRVLRGRKVAEVEWDCRVPLPVGFFVAFGYCCWGGWWGEFEEQSGAPFWHCPDRGFEIGGGGGERAEGEEVVGGEEVGLRELVFVGEEGGGEGEVGVEGAGLGWGWGGVGEGETESWVEACGVGEGGCEVGGSEVVAGGEGEECWFCVGDRLALC